MSLAYVKLKGIKGEKAALKDLSRHLANYNIHVIASEKHYTEIPELQFSPFLHFEDAFIRMRSMEPLLAKMHINTAFPFIKSSNGDIISINPLNMNRKDNYCFVTKNATYRIPEHTFTDGPIIEKKKRALMTMIQDGTPYFDLWLKYYKRYFSPEDIYLICCRTSDDAFKALDSSVRKITTSVNVYNIVDKLAMLNRFQEDLLHSYEMVVYADIDEILFHEKGLDNTLDESLPNINRCQGYDIVHLRNKEADLNINLSLMTQRKFWARSPLYDKPVILKAPAAWTPGLHEVETSEKSDWRDLAKSIPGLLLLHLRNADYSIARNLNLKNIKNDEKPAFGGDQVLYQGNKFDRWWASFEKNASPIPNAILKTFNF
jgi:hypothetical protein